MIKKLKLQNCIKLLGTVERKDIPSFLSSLDLYVQSSISEGSPLTIKEAMAAALPVVSTNAGGIPEMILEGKTGFIIPHSQENKFVDSIINIVNMDSSQRLMIGENARKYAKTHFSISSLIKEQFNYYRGIISRHS